MATIPVPLSYSQIVGGMTNALLSKLGLPKLQIGNPALSVIEAAAQSDLRVSQDIFNLLTSISVTTATGVALDNIGADLNTPRIPASQATGTLSFTDSSFTKIATLIFPGTPAPIVGSASINVTNASLFPASGQIYIGRGTTDYEGPLSYTSVVNNVNYWTINLAVGNYTSKYHQLNETVILAQGGNRNINVGTLVQTPQGNTSTSLQYETLYLATIPDGETTIAAVPAICTVSGSIGNIPSGVVNSFLTPPFTGATVINDSPFTNGLDTETDSSYSERLQNVKQSLSRGTPLALTTAVVGITALDENKRVLSASVVTQDNNPTTLYIDDGTGYEAIWIGIPYEVLVDSALGGEQYLQLVQGRPVQKAQAVTLLSAPFNLAITGPGSVTLAAVVGGVLSTHSFSPSDFRSQSNATAFEVSASINADPNVLFIANPTHNGTQISLSAKADTNESIAVVPPGPTFTDANIGLGFPAGTVDTLRLYKNDRLLSKDGAPAELVSQPQAAWGSLMQPQTLALSVDGIVLQDGVTPGLVTFTDADFVNAATGYTTLSAGNSLASWAAVFNYRLAGITATVTTGAITLQSNRGNSSSAAVVIGACSLVTNGVFNVGASHGISNDYTLDRNLGQIRLNDNEVLVPGDRLTAGSLWTRAFLSSAELTTVTLNSVATSVVGQNGAELWFVVDGNAQLVKTGIGPATALTWSVAASPSWGKRVQITSTAAMALFSNVLPGDWVVINDLGVSQPNRGAYRVAQVDVGFTWIQVEYPSTYASAESDTLQSGGVTVVRTLQEVQRVFIAAGSNYTATSLAAAIVLVGATAVVYNTQFIRVRTNNFSTLPPVVGDIALVAANSEGLKLTLPVSSAVQDQTSHLASVLAGNPDAGTPFFTPELSITAVGSTTAFTMNTALATGAWDSGLYLASLKPLPDAGPLGRYNNWEHVTGIFSQSGTAFVIEKAPVEFWLPGDRFYAAHPYAIAPLDQLTVLIDGNTASERFVQNMYRDCGTVGTTYSNVLTLTDADAANQSLAVIFGTTMDWVDFAVMMPARVKDNRSPGDTTSTMLWRYNRLGPDGNNARIAYGYPSLPSAPIGVNTVSTVDQYTDITVTLSTGPARTGTTLRTTTHVGVAVDSGPVSGLYEYVYVFNLPVSTAQRVIQLNYVSGTIAFSPATTVTGQTSGATGTITVVTGSTATGTLTLTAVVGTFLNGENLQVAAVTHAVASGSQYGLTTLTLTLPASITNHGLMVGNVIWTESGSVNYATGPYALSAVTATTVSYIENTNSVAPGAITATVSFDNSGEATLNGSTVVSGDLVAVNGGSFPAGFQQTLQTTAEAAGYVTANSPVAGSVTTTLSWYLAGTNVTFFPLNAGGNAITAIATAINAITNSPVTAVALGVGGVNSGVITGATYELSYLGGTNPWWYLSDGLNWVQSTNVPGTPATNFIFTLKDNVTAALATNSDWAHETVKLVPSTALNVVNYLDTPGPGGLFNAADIEVAADGRRPQIASNTLGSVGSVAVQGGTSNSVSSPVVGSAIDVSPYMVVNCSYADSLGFFAGNWVRLQNTLTVPKANIDAGTELLRITASGIVGYQGGSTPAWDFAGVTTAPIKGLTWLVEKQGNFTAYTYFSGGAPTLTGVKEGDWVHISTAITLGTMSTLNQGLFRIVRIDTTNNIFWVENQNSFEQLASADVAFLTYDSTMPGDLLIIGTNLWGAANVGTWMVTSIFLTTYGEGQLDYTGLSGVFILGEIITGNTSLVTGKIVYDDGVGSLLLTSVRGQFLLGETIVGGTSGASATTTSVFFDNLNSYSLNTSPVAPTAQGPVAALGANAPLIRIQEGSPSRLYKLVQGINQNQSNPQLADVKFTTDAGYTKVSATAGTYILVQDKLAFPTATEVGIDGYQETVGLIGQANLVAYGDEADPSTYPGIVAAGANVNISGPVVLRVQISLAIRTQSGVNQLDIEDQVQSAVAAVVNQTGVGVPVAISSLVNAAQSVNGVTAVSVLSPSYGPGNDLIAVQPFEKPLVLSIDTDVLVSFVGT